VKAMDKESGGFAYLRQKFPKVSEAEMKEGIFVGPQITQLFDDQDLAQNLFLQKEEPGRDLKTSAETSQSTKKRKITLKLCRR
jgi:ABC-type transport system involved in Fe-S cluster assembly fused permease/ATPase subunit